MEIQAHNVLTASGTDSPSAAVSGVAHVDQLPQSIDDVRQETQISTTFALNPYLRAEHIKVYVKDATATLTGFALEAVHKELAKIIAMGVPGILEVDNQILVQADYIAPTPSIERSYGEMIDDANITAAIKSKLMWSNYSNGLGTDIDTAWRKVTLTGSVDTAAAKDLAGRLAINTWGVESVDNQLEVIISKAEIKQNADNVARDIADSWITTKVKSTFLYTSNINSTDINIATRDGVVMLEGKVGSLAEHKLAVELAQHIRGVKSVNADALNFN
ncbi:MAG: BON domain-containing protein [Arenimonas sp.]